MRLHTRAGVLSHIGNERACKTSALLPWAAPEETASAVFQCLVGKNPVLIGKKMTRASSCYSTVADGSRSVTDGVEKL